MYITNPDLLNELKKDPRIAFIEQDKLGHFASASTVTTTTESVPDTIQLSQHQTTPTGIQRYLIKQTQEVAYKIKPIIDVMASYLEQH